MIGSQTEWALGLVVATSVAISVVITRVVRRIASAHGALDHAVSSRKVHRRPVPRLGGIAIVVAVYASLAIGLCVPVVRNVFAADAVRLTGLALGGMLVALLGVADDLWGVVPAKKLFVQFCVALLFWSVGFRIECIETPFGPDLVLSAALGLPLTVLWIVGVSNAINLIDGLDGLASGIVVIAMVAVFAIGAHANDLVAMMVAMALLGAVAGFLGYNISPASIFMGDSGSMFLGAVVAALAVRPHEEPGRPVHLVGMVVVLAIPIADTVLAFVRRAARGRPVFSADRDHTHHHLLDAGLSQSMATMALWAGTAILAAAGVLIVTAEPGRRLIIFVTITVASFFALYKLGMLDFLGRDLGLLRRRNFDRFRAVRQASGALHATTAMSEVRTVLMAAAPVFGVEMLSLQLSPDAELAQHAATGSAVTRFALDPTHPGLGHLEVRWRDSTFELDRDTEVAFEQLSQQVARAVRRITVAETNLGFLQPLAVVRYRTPGPRANTNANNH